MYAKLINGTLRSAPKKVDYNGKIIFNPTEEILLELGYLPVTYTDMPTDAPDGQHYESSWKQNDTEIVQAWTLIENPAEPEPEVTQEERIEALESQNQMLVECLMEMSETVYA